MKEVRIISLSGNIGAGKSYIANIAVNQFGYKQFLLAGVVKSIVCQLEGIRLEELENRETKEKYRPLIIEYAEKMKEVDPLCFCKCVYNQILSSLSDKTKLIIVDLRYPFECSYFETKCKTESKYQLSYKSLYIESDLANKSSTHSSESWNKYLKANADGIIFNGTEERYSRNRLINQLARFL